MAVQIMTYRGRRRNNKYGNRKIVIDGYTFDSTKEGNRYMELKYMLAAGKIKDLEIHKPFVLEEGFRDRDGKWQQDIRYVSDFVYYDTEKNETVIEDVKSDATKKDKVYRLKKKMMMKRGLYITEV